MSQARFIVKFPTQIILLADYHLMAHNKHKIQGVSLHTFPSLGTFGEGLVL